VHERVVFATLVCMEPQHLVLYDGDCGVCHRTVQWILREDARGMFRFAPLQGPTAAAVRARHPDLPTDLDSVIYVDRSSGAERVSVRSEAIFEIARRLGGWAARLAAFRALPRALTDAAYGVFARNRHRVSSTLGVCPLPPPTTEARFLP
jgi:predicted DCC family thiol-disulfide oxidoreductase YuxK